MTKTPKQDLRSNEEAMEEFRSVAHRLETEESDIINNENYAKLLEINEVNDELQKKYTGADNDKLRSANQSTKAYDMSVFKQDMKNCRKVVDTGHSLCLKNNESNCYKHDWKAAVDGVKSLNNQLRTMKSQNLSRDHIHHAAHRLFVFTGFPSYGATAPLFHSANAISKLAVVKPKKDPETIRREREIRQERQQKVKDAELKTKEKAKEQAKEQEDYNQDDGQISTKVLQAVETIVKKQIEEKVKTGLAAKIEYIPAIVDSKSFAKTVENMFHLAFLVKDGKIGIQLDRYYIPHIFIPGNEIDAAKSNNRNSNFQPGKHGNQGIMSMNMSTWRKYIELLDLKEQENIFAKMNTRR